jgi:hypothetical protein
MEVVEEVKAGKNRWNNYEVGLKEGHIFIRDDSGYIDFTEDEIDELVQAVDQARRRLREIKRQPTNGE